MNKEQQELVNEAYIKYQNQTMFHTDDLVSLKELDGMYMSTGEKTKVYRQFAPKEFINKCQTDQEFSEKWGLKIEEQELSLKERYDWFIKTYNTNLTRSSNQYNMEDILSSNNCPNKLITITYQDQKIENYE